MPTVAHQRIVDYLAAELKAYFKRNRIGGDVLTAPLPIRLRAGKFREPDVVYRRPGRIAAPDSQPDGADLVIEVVSDGERNRERDLQTKRIEYAAAGIDEYWIVDSHTRTVTVLAASDSHYRIHAECGAGETAASATFGELRLDVSALFADADRSNLDV
jgi:Uma2 family endonuclease